MEETETNTPTQSENTEKQQQVNKSEHAYTAKEQELIKQLVKARNEQNTELAFENLDGYEVPPRTQFSMLKKPAVSIKYGKLIFNMACIRLFEGIRNILTVVNPTKKRLAVIMCQEEELSSVEWARMKDNNWVKKTISSIEFVEKLFRLMRWDMNCRYKILGRVAQSERGLILVFDLSEAIMFAPQPVEYIDDSGKTKKRQVKYFPDIYRDHIGKTYNDYMTTHQISMFESLSEYTENSEQDVTATLKPTTSYYGDGHE